MAVKGKAEALAKSTGQRVNTRCSTRHEIQQVSGHISVTPPGPIGLNFADLKSPSTCYGTKSN